MRDEAYLCPLHPFVRCAGLCDMHLTRDDEAGSGWVVSVFLTEMEDRYARSVSTRRGLRCGAR